jgi:hypothetical protein
LKLSNASPRRRVSGKLGLVLHELVRNTERFQAIVSFVSVVGIKGVKRKAKMVFNWMYLCAVVDLDSRQEQVIVLDQGFSQALWSTFFYAEEIPDATISVNFLHKLLHKLPVGDLLIVNVFADDESIKRRISGREGASPLDRNLDRNWIRAIRVTQATKAAIEQFSRQNPDCEIVDYPNHDNGINANQLHRIWQALDNTRRHG